MDFNIDNVDYADILPEEQEEPKNPTGAQVENDRGANPPRA